MGVRVDLHAHPKLELQSINIQHGGDGDQRNRNLYISKCVYKNHKYSKGGAMRW